MQRGCRLGQWEQGRACPSANIQAVGVVPPVSSNGPARRGWAPPPISTNQMGRAGPAAPNRRLRSGIQTDRWKRGRWRRSGPDGTGNGGGGARPGLARRCPSSPPPQPPPPCQPAAAPSRTGAWPCCAAASASRC